jgi:hypothetical protein
VITFYHTHHQKKKKNKFTIIIIIIEIYMMIRSILRSPAKKNRALWSGPEQHADHEGGCSSKPEYKDASTTISSCGDSTHCPSPPHRADKINNHNNHNNINHNIIINNNNNNELAQMALEELKSSRKSQRFKPQNSSSKSIIQSPSSSPLKVPKTPQSASPRKRSMSSRKLGGRGGRGGGGGRSGGGGGLGAFLSKANGKSKKQQDIISTTTDAEEEVKSVSTMPASMPFAAGNYFKRPSRKIDCCASISKNKEEEEEDEENENLSIISSPKSVVAATKRSRNVDPSAHLITNPTSTSPSTAATAAAAATTTTILRSPRRSAASTGRLARSPRGRALSNRSLLQQNGSNRSLVQQSGTAGRALSNRSLLDDDARKQLAYSWYSRCGCPVKKEMIRRVNAMSSQGGLCDITVADVELLPWNSSGTMVIMTTSKKMMVHRKDVNQENDHEAATAAEEESPPSSTTGGFMARTSRSNSFQLPGSYHSTAHEEDGQQQNTSNDAGRALSSRSLVVQKEDKPQDFQHDSISFLSSSVAQYEDMMKDSSRWDSGWDIEGNIITCPPPPLHHPDHDVPTATSSFPKEKKPTVTEPALSLPLPPPPPPPPLKTPKKKTKRDKATLTAAPPQPPPMTPNTKKKLMSPEELEQEYFDILSAFNDSSRVLMKDPYSSKSLRGFGGSSRSTRNMNKSQLLSSKRNMLGGTTKTSNNTFHDVDVDDLVNHQQTRSVPTARKPRAMLNRGGVVALPYF